MKAHQRVLSQFAVAAAVVGGLYIASAVSADAPEYCENHVGQKAAAESAVYQPDSATQGNHAALILDPDWSSGFEHHFGSSRQPDYEVIPVTSTIALPVKSADISVVLSGSLRRLDKAATIAQSSFVGAALIRSDGEHMALLICLNPAGAKAGEYRGAIQVFAAKNVDPLAIPVDVTFQPENGFGYFAVGALIVLLGIVLKVFGDLEKLSAQPNNKIPFGQVWRMYRADWTRLGIIVAALTAGVIALLISYFRNQALVGGFDDIWTMAAAVLAAELGVGSFGDLAAYVQPSTVKE